jgi:hypothetical protein
MPMRAPVPTGPVGNTGSGSLLRVIWRVGRTRQPWQALCLRTKPPNNVNCSNKTDLLIILKDALCLSTECANKHNP